MMANNTLGTASPNTLSFDCKQCGHCCRGGGGIVVSAKDLARLCNRLGLSPQKFEEQWGERRGKKLHIKAGEDGLCIFFTHGQGCRVHDVKPDICRAWPYFRGNLADQESFELAKGSCPGIPPEQGHAVFVLEGLDYLQGNSLVGGNMQDEANALQVDDLLKRYGRK